MKNIKKSSLEISLIRLEIEEAKQFHDDAKRDLESILLKLDLAKREPVNPDHIPEIASAESSDNEIDKTLFKLIAKNTHPDITDDPLKNAYFKEASKYLETGDTDKLIEICQNVSIDVGKYSEKIIDALLDVKSNLAKELNRIKNSEFYVWYFFTEDKKVLTIYDMCLKMKKDITVEEILNIIRGQQSANDNELTLTNR